MGIPYKPLKTGLILLWAILHLRKKISRFLMNTLPVILFAA